MWCDVDVDTVYIYLFFVCNIKIINKRQLHLLLLPRLPSPLIEREESETSDNDKKRTEPHNIRRIRWCIDDHCAEHNGEKSLHGENQVQHDRIA